MHRHFPVRNCDLRYRFGREEFFTEREVLWKFCQYNFLRKSAHLSPANIITLTATCARYQLYRIKIGQLRDLMRQSFLPRTANHRH